MKRFIFGIIAVGLLLLFVDCGDQGANAITGLGTVIYSSLEGGCWGIKLDNGNEYDTYDLPQAYQQDGLRVRIVAKLSRGQAGYCSFGPIIDIIQIYKI